MEKNVYRYPKRWSVYAKEIETLLLEFSPTYEKKKYIKPIFVIDGFSSNPYTYPELSKLTISMQKKYVPLFLKAQGRIARGSGRNTKTWMIP